MSKPRWHRTADRRPKNHRRVVGWYPDMGPMVVERCGRGYYDETGGEFGPPACWMRLRKPPKSTREGKP